MASRIDHTLRIGDRERADAVERLSVHAAAGRLTVPELEARLERAHAAVVAADLHALEADLPAPERRGRRKPPVALAVGLVVLLVTVALATGLAVGHPIPPLPVLVVALLWRARWRPRPPTWRAHAHNGQELPSGSS